MIAPIEGLRATRHSVRKEILCHPGIVGAMNWARQHRALYFPGGGNLGDGLIGLGAQDLFEHFGLKLDTRTGWDTDVLRGIRYLVVNGSGGFAEGLWKDFVRVLEPFFEAGGEAVLLPSTVSGYRDFFTRYGRQITVFAREQVSYEHLRSIEALEGRVHLCHDLAFAVDFERTGWPEGLAGTEARLSLLRADEESRGHAKPRDNIDLALIWNSIQWTNRSVCMPPLSAAAQLIYRFDDIESDRLHMSVLAALMGKRVTMRPNAYFKNKAVYEHSLHRFAHVIFANDSPDGQPELTTGNIWTAHAELQKTCEALRADSEALSRCQTELHKAHAELQKTCEALREDSEALSRCQAELHKAHTLLAEQRARTIEIAARYDTQAALNAALIADYEALNAALIADCEAMRVRLPQPDFRGSRGYRIWLWYLRLYERPLMGRVLRGARKIVKPVLALRRWLRRLT